LVPGQVIRDKLSPFRKDKKSYPCKTRSNHSLRDIIDMYNAEIRGLYEYYCLATDVSTKLESFRFFHYGSMLKTIAGKERSTVGAVVRKYGIAVSRKQGVGTKRVVGVHYKTKAGCRTLTYFDGRLVRVEYPPVNVSDRFGQPLGGKLLLKRLNANVCELCGSSKGIVVHHVRKLKDVEQKYGRYGRTAPEWVLAMMRIHRRLHHRLRRCWKNHESIKVGRSYYNNQV